MKFFIFLIGITLGITIGITIGWFSFGSHSAGLELEYKNGYPSNCRTLIYESQFDYTIRNKYSAEDILTSIFRNCGDNGILWDGEL